MKAQLYLPSQQRGLVYLFGVLLFIWTMGKLSLHLFPSQPIEQAFFPKVEKPLLDLNLASAAELEKLRGIGPVLAQRVVAYRKKIGGFKSHAELAEVYGLKPEVIEGFHEKICVDSLDANPGPEKPRKYPAKRVLDPNRASAAELKALPGIGEKISQRIVKFRETGASFTQVSDLKKIYGFSDENYQRALPYLKVVPLPQKKILRVNLNKAGKEELMALPGIGEKLSDRILKFRELLGFFVEKEQLQAVYGLSGETFERVQPLIFIGKPLPPPAKRLNEANAWQLGLYPSVSKELAGRILERRKLKGDFSTWEEVAEIEGVDKKVLAELKSYFTL